MPRLGRATPIILVAALPALMLVSGTARAQLAAHPISPPMQQASSASCRTTVRYFGKGSLTADYSLEHVGGEYPWMVPPHAIARLVAHTGPMAGSAFFESQMWQKVRELGTGACRFLSRHRPLMHMTVTDRHGRRVGLIIAVLRGDGVEPTP